MKGERKYYVIIFSIFLILFLIQQSQKEPTNYDHTYSHRDKNPYGGYVLKTLLPEFFGDNEVQSLNLTLYELEDQFKFDSNLILIADQINLSDEDTDVLLDGVSLGMTAFVSANVIGGKLADTLKFFTARNEIEYVASGNKDTSSVSLVHPSLAGNDFRFKRDAIANYFDDLDSLDHKVLANNAEGKPVAITVKWGAGKIVLCTTPLAFTNNYFFFEENSRFASALMNELPAQSTIWTEYYQLGRLQFGSPLSIIMKTSALRLAYTITLVSLALFMIFEAKRKQRIIPIIVPVSIISEAVISVSIVSVIMPVPIIPIITPVVVIIVSAPAAAIS